MEPQSSSMRRAGARAASEGPGLARVLANPRRARILTELYLRPLSVSQIVEEFGGDKSTVSRQIRLLEEWGYVEVVDEKSGGRRRGGVERIYRSTQRDLLDTKTWSTLSLPEREGWSRNALALVLRRITEAVDAGTFDAEVDRHLSWDALMLDRVAWEKLGAMFDEILDRLPDIVAEAAQRMAETGEEPIPATIVASLFRAPTASQLRRLRSAEAGGSKNGGGGAPRRRRAGGPRPTED